MIIAAKTYKHKNWGEINNHKTKYVFKHRPIQSEKTVSKKYIHFQKKVRMEGREGGRKENKIGLIRIE